MRNVEIQLPNSIKKETSGVKSLLSYEENKRLKIRKKRTKKEKNRKKKKLCNSSSKFSTNTK